MLKHRFLEAYKLTRLPQPFGWLLRLFQEQSLRFCPTDKNGRIIDAASACEDLLEKEGAEAELRKSARKSARQSGAQFSSAEFNKSLKEMRMTVNHLAWGNPD